ncbi:hypothetical protein LMG19282_05484 [Cupriavidus campinensis]|nr:hypothetical protein LMG19282_05484 [Cupriavidus campinensis]
MAAPGLGKHGQRHRGGLGGVGAVPQAVRHHHVGAVVVHGHIPAVAADRLARRGHAYGAHIEAGAGAARRAVGIVLAVEAGQDQRALAGAGVDVEVIGQPADRAQALAGAAAGGIAVAQAGLEVGHAGAVIDRNQLDGDGVAQLARAHQQPAAPGVADEVVAQLVDGHGQPAGLDGVEAVPPGQFGGGAAGLAHAAAVAHRHGDVRAQVVTSTE